MGVICAHGNAVIRPSLVHNSTGTVHNRFAPMGGGVCAVRQSRPRGLNASSNGLNETIASDYEVAIAETRCALLAI
jgi:hypothetical protein